MVSSLPPRSWGLDDDDKGMSYGPVPSASRQKPASPVGVEKLDRNRWRVTWRGQHVGIIQVIERILGYHRSVRAVFELDPHPAPTWGPDTAASWGLEQFVYDFASFQEALTWARRTIRRASDTIPET